MSEWIKASFIFLNLADIFFEGRETEDDAREIEKEWT